MSESRGVAPLKISGLLVKLEQLFEQHGDVEIRVESDYGGIVEYVQVEEVELREESGSKYALIR